MGKERYAETLSNFIMFNPCIPVCSYVCQQRDYINSVIPLMKNLDDSGSLFSRETPCFMQPLTLSPERL